MVKVEKVDENSIAFKKGIRSGDEIISINDKEITDKLDYMFYSIEFPLIMNIMREGKEFSVSIEAGSDEEETDLGIEVEELKIKHCGNNCVFCFVSQNPDNMRKSLYIRDEDYRYSFLYGSYFTMTTIREKELKRIVEQRLTPLYISVHAVNPKVRKKLLGIKREDNLLEKMNFLADHGIEMHTQVVMCPDINDGDVLKETISTMYDMFPHVASVAVVPLGKTDHRKKCVELRSVTKEDAEKAIDIIEGFQEEFLEEIGTRFVFPADEFYLRAERQVPEDECYEEYSQYEDGVGMVRSFIEDFSKAKLSFPKSLKKKFNLVFVTGKSFYKVLKSEACPVFDKIRKFNVEVLAVENTLFGKEITIAGLIGGRDIIRTVKEYSDTISKPDNKPNLIVLPNTCLNFDKVLIDDMTLGEVEKELGFKVVQFTDYDTLFDIIKNS